MAGAAVEEEALRHAALSPTGAQPIHVATLLRAHDFDGAFLSALAETCLRETTARDTFISRNSLKMSDYQARRHLQSVTALRECWQLLADAAGAHQLRLCDLLRHVAAQIILDGPATARYKLDLDRRLFCVYMGNGYGIELRAEESTLYLSTGTGTAAEDFHKEICGTLCGDNCVVLAMPRDALVNRMKMMLQEQHDTMSIRNVSYLLEQCTHTSFEALVQALD